MDKAHHARLLADQRYMSGWRPKKLLTGGNTKLEKSARTLGLSLAPANTSGYEVCASRSVECTQRRTRRRHDAPHHRRQLRSF